jgi:hypothetical protein
MHATGPGDRLHAVVCSEHAIDPGEVHLHRANGRPSRRAIVLVAQPWDSR